MGDDSAATHLVRGRYAERLAETYLTKHGYQIVERNYRCRQGEVDLIALQRDTLHFVEVKGRWSHKFGGPLQQLSARQARRISRAAEMYLLQKGWQERYRIRLSFLGVDSSSQPPQIHFIPDAFAP